MRLRDDELVGLRVETNVGRRLGTLAGFVVDADTGFIVQYRVRPRGIVAACFPGLRELLIAQSDVLSIDERRMVVREVSGVVSSEGKRKRMVPSMHPQPLTSQQE